MSEATNPHARSARRTPAAGPPGPRPRWRLLYYGVAVLALAVAATAVYGLVVPQASTAEVKVGAPAPDATFATTDGVQHRLSQFRGRPVMLWLFATWCPTCQAGTAAVARYRAQLEQAGLQILQLKLFDNLGYPGPSAQEFAKAFAGPVPPSSGWVWGDASQAASFTYDPKGYPDIYFLIDRQGIVRAISSAPNVTMDQILSFARAGR